MRNSQDKTLFGSMPRGGAAIAGLACLLISACATPTWRAQTKMSGDMEVCRVEYGSSFGRSITRSVESKPLVYFLFVENQDGAIRIGVDTQPSQPIDGMAHLIIDGGLPVTISSAAIGQVKSAYGAVTGFHAESIIKRMVVAREIELRVEAADGSYLGGGQIIPDSGFTSSLLKCGIAL